MKKLCRLSLTLFFIFQFSHAFSALPPLYQSIKEIKVLMDLEEIQRKLGSGQAITGIKRTEEGYLVTTEECQLQVRIQYLRTPMAGPVRFLFHLGNYRCRP